MRMTRGTVKNPSPLLRLVYHTETTKCTRNTVANKHERLLEELCFEDKLLHSNNLC